MSATVNTYVFLDLESTGLPWQENNRTKITEISLIAVKREHLLNCSNLPRVQQKLTLCVNPQKMVHPDSTKITGLCNYLLETEVSFNNKVFTILNAFLELLAKPVCLISHNGLGFDFPILRRQLMNIGVNFSEDLLCADSYFGFYDIMEGMKKSEASKSEGKPGEDELDFINDNPLAMKSINETTPKTFKLKNRSLKISNKCKVRRRLPWSAGERPKESYKLCDVYERLLNKEAKDVHTAEGDCTLCLECAARLGDKFVVWVDQHCCPLVDVEPMTIGLLILTGVLWGCTNPFIRQGTRGLRDVRANTLLGRAYAEIVFLLGNWKYVVPWALNQTGSVAYVVAVRHAPLSLAVPAANSLAAAATALTGAALGAEEPLDSGSIMGIVLIGIGTALCCWDKT